MQELKKPTAGRPRGTKSFDPAPAIAFGAAVRESRLKVGLSQEELASTAQVERSHMGKIERGEHMPNLVLILRLAKSLAVTPGYLLDRAVELM
jgi:transcriptional regulator with XRE-family HTH domain